MDILPAIDLLAGKCVRLVQGRYDRMIDYERDPVEVAIQFRDLGARWLHVVDLEGARDGRLANLPALERIAAETKLPVEFGGGMRDEQSIRLALDAGAARVIIGTRALEDWEWFRGAALHPDFAGKLALGLDARQGKLATRGWMSQTDRTAIEVAEAVADWPLSAIIYTDIGRDGLLLGPNIEAIRTLAEISSVPVIASGGVTDLDDIKRLRELKLLGIVVGRAIYEGTLELRAALAEVSGSKS